MKQKAEMALRMMDLDKDGKVSRDDYINFANSMMPKGAPPMPRSTMEMAFNAYDDNKNGYLDREEYMKYMMAPE